MRRASKGGDEMCRGSQAFEITCSWYSEGLEFLLNGSASSSNRTCGHPKQEMIGDNDC